MQVPTWKCPLLGIWMCIFGFYKEGHAMEVWIVLIHLLKDIKECSSDALYGNLVVNIQTPNSSAWKGSIHQLGPTLDRFLQIINPLSPALGCLISLSQQPLLYSCHH